MNRALPIVVRLASLAAAVLAAVVITTPAALAQGPTRLEFSFSNPGARSLGFGGAFVAVADDATAAFANPAGLVQLIRPEVSAEGRLWSYDTPYLESGRLSGEPTGIGIDTQSGTTFGTSSHDAAGLSFISGVMPVRRWSFALYRHRIADFSSQFETRGLFGEVGGQTVRYEDARLDVDLDLVSYGFSVAYGLTEKFSLGLGVSYHDGTMSINQEVYLPPAVFLPTPYVDENLIVRTQLVTADNDWTFLAGVLWEVAPRFSLGGFYRQGAKVTLSGTAIAGGQFDPGVPAGTELGSGSTPFGFPDVYGLGMAYRSGGERLTLSFEWDRVEYSDLLDEIDPEVIDLDNITVDDADELHAGMEWVFLRTTPIVALRFGAWLDPEHRIRDVTDREFESALSPAGEDELHFSAGLGFVFGRFQLDAGIDLSELVDTAALSAIYRF